MVGIFTAFKTAEEVTTNYDYESIGYAPRGRSLNRQMLLVKDVFTDCDYPTCMTPPFVTFGKTLNY